MHYFIFIICMKTIISIKMLSYAIKSKIFLAVIMILFSSNSTMVRAECQGNHSVYFVYKPNLKGNWSSFGLIFNFGLNFHFYLSKGLRYTYFIIFFVEGEESTNFAIRGVLISSLAIFGAITNTLCILVFSVPAMKTPSTTILRGMKKL